ncbi:MAG: hypothetical protein FP816_14935 [Desulfobacteraceae bacterium]|nr:hypothetical protein [Desulfobacteraceae bacterium]
MKINSSTDESLDATTEPLNVYEEHHTYVHRKFELYPSWIIFRSKHNKGPELVSTIQLIDLRPDIVEGKTTSASFVMSLTGFLTGAAIIGPIMHLGVIKEAQFYLYIGMFFALMGGIGLVTNKWRPPCLKIYNQKGKEAVRIGPFNNDTMQAAGISFSQAIRDQMNQLPNSSKSQQ